MNLIQLTETDLLVAYLKANYAGVRCAIDYTSYDGDLEIYTNSDDVEFACWVLEKQGAIYEGGDEKVASGQGYIKHLCAVIEYFPEATRQLILARLDHNYQTAEFKAGNNHAEVYQRFIAQYRAGTLGD